jgi:hypothetical protein
VISLGAVGGKVPVDTVADEDATSSGPAKSVADILFPEGKYENFLSTYVYVYVSPVSSKKVKSLEFTTMDFKPAVNLTLSNISVVISVNRTCSPPLTALNSLMGILYYPKIFLHICCLLFKG